MKSYSYINGKNSPTDITGRLCICFLSVLIVFITSGNLHSQLLTIDEIKFTHHDTKSFDDDILVSALGMSESDVYKPEVLEDNIYKLQKFYFDNGFFDAKIDTGVRYNIKDEEVYLNIKITENKHYRIDSLLFTGLDTLSQTADKLIKEIKIIRSGDFYDRSLITQQTNEIVDLLQNNGYMNARVKEDSGTVVKKYENAQTQRLTVEIHFKGADSIFYFGKTKIKIIENKYGVDQSMLEEEIVFHEGEIYNKEKKLESESNITKVSIVQSVRISPSEITGDKVDFTAEVYLTNKTEIGPYAKATVIDNVFYAGGGVQYINRYFSRSGKILNLSVDALLNSFEDNRFEVSAELTQPNIFNNRSFLTDKVTVGLYNIGETKNYYVGNLISYLQQFPEYTFYKNASLDFTTEFVRFKEIDTDIPPFTVFNSILSATVVHDNTDKISSPTRGFYQSLTVGSGGLIPKLIIEEFEPNLYYSQYLKFFTSNNLYVNISRLPGETVLATKFLLGDIIEYGSGERLVPLQPFYKFFSGGSSSVRGWSAKTNGVLVNTNDGGDFLVEGSIELRRMLFAGSESFKKNISAAFFFDYGNVWPADEDFRFSQIALALGFGVRYNLPIGPVRVDFGFKLFDPATGANERWLFNDFSNTFGNRFVIHFGIGEAF